MNLKDFFINLTASAGGFGIVAVAYLVPVYVRMAVRVRKDVFFVHPKWGRAILYAGASSVIVTYTTILWGVLTNRTIPLVRLSLYATGFVLMDVAMAVLTLYLTRAYREATKQ